MLWALIMISAIAFADESKQVQFIRDAASNPYRKIGDQIYNIVPLEKFLERTMTMSKEEFEVSHNALMQPLKGWTYFQGVVASVRDGGLLVTLESYPGTKAETIYLTNYSPFKGTAEADALKFFAMRSGAYSYKAKSGEEKTVKRYDFGQIISEKEFTDYVASIRKMPRIPDDTAK